MSDINAIIFTDLDGTLLDHKTYSYAEAQPALATLQAQQIPLILASSKTAAEVMPLRAELGFDHCPAIVENGAGLLAAGAETAQDCSAYVHLLTTLNAAPADLRASFVGFHEWDVKEIADRTGLSPAQASLAASRAFSEPGLLQGAQAGELLEWLLQHGISARRGGRFVTLSFGGRKSDQMAKIVTNYVRDGVAPTSLALGDAPNDVEMLDAADCGVIIANAAHDPLPEMAGEREGRIIRTAVCGPAAWNDAVLQWLDRFQSSH